MNKTRLDTYHKPNGLSAITDRKVTTMNHSIFEYYNEHFDKKPRLEHYTADGWLPDSTCELINRMLDTGFLDPSETQKWLLANNDR
mgnify:CR=1 FL=1